MQDLAYRRTFEGTSIVLGEEFDTRVDLNHFYVLSSTLKIAGCTFRDGLTLSRPQGLRRLIVQDCTITGQFGLACRLSHLELDNVQVDGTISAYKLRFSIWRSFLALPDLRASEIIARCRRDAQRFHWAAPTIPVTFGWSRRKN